jgi:hypothetical protein
VPTQQGSHSGSSSKRQPGRRSKLSRGCK